MEQQSWTNTKSGARLYRRVFCSCMAQAQCPALHIAPIRYMHHSINCIYILIFDKMYFHSYFQLNLFTLSHSIRYMHHSINCIYNKNKNKNVNFTFLFSIKCFLYSYSQSNVHSINCFYILFFNKMYLYAYSQSNIYIKCINIPTSRIFTC